MDNGNNRFVHHIVLNVPLIVNKYIPKDIVLTTDSGGVNHTVAVSEVCVKSLYIFIINILYRHTAYIGLLTLFYTG